MSGLKEKESDDVVMHINNEQGQTNDDAWLYFAITLTGEANNLQPEQDPFI